MAPTEATVHQDPAPARRARIRRRSWVIAISAALVVVIAGGVGLSLLLGSGDEAPTKQEVQRVHDVLHDIDALCPAGTVAAGEARSRLERDADADAVVTFARRYPDASFPIDDETGRSLTLLMVTRQGLLTCLSDAAARIDAALPEQFRIQSVSTAR